MDFNSDTKTGLLLVGIILAMIIVAYIADKVMEYRKCKKRLVEYEEQMNALQEKESHERAERDFYKLNIDIEMDRMLEEEGLK
jgi:uncharacterized membrane protein (DUF106 family)